jgi:serine/threonine protein kinase/Flp pilus assembly protein TadD
LSASATASDRNLLFGILAVQMNFIGKDALISAMHAWVLDKHKPLGQILVEQKVLAGETQQLLDALVHKHLEMHGGDAEKSLAALSSVGSIRHDLGQIADPAVQASLASVGPDDPFVTRGGAPPVRTSGGMRFRVLRPHARGGLGEVFVAEDEELRREVALKEIQARHADNPESRARFLQEAEITGGLEHPGIVPVYGLGQYADGRPYYAMRFIKGDSLKDAIERFHRDDGKPRDDSAKGLELRELLGRFVDVCNAIAYAHSRGVLHRDLKPGNVMLGKYGETLVVDWGLAKPLGQKEATQTAEEQPVLPSKGAGSVETVAGSAIGTPQFMSPEQAAGRLQQLGTASDVYSLGATLYCLLTGKPPFGAADVGTTLQKVQRGDFPPPKQIDSEVPAALQAICLKAMALKPEARYVSPRALADDIEHWLADEPVSAWPEPWTARASRWARRHRTAVTSMGVAVLLAAAGVITIVFVEHRREQQAREYLANLRSSAEAEGKLAGAEMSVGRFASAQAILAQACDRLAGEPELKAMRAALETRRDRVQRLVNFYRLADEAERLAFEEKIADTLAAGQSALNIVDVMRTPDWWAHLPDTDLTAAQRDHLQNEVNRLMYLVAALRVSRSFTAAEPTADLRAALDLSERAGRFRPSHFGQLLQRGCHLALGETDRARPLPAAEPSSAIDYYFLGFLNWQTSKRPDNPFARFIVRAQGDLPGAVDFKAPLATAEEFFRKALRLEPQSYFTYVILSDTLRQGHRFAEAELAADGAIGLRPDYEAGYRFRAATNFERGRNESDPQRKKEYFDRAVADCSRAIALNPKYAESYNLRGLVRSYQGADAQAMADYNEAIRLDPKNAFYRIVRGHAYAHQKDFTRALADLDEAIRLNAKEPRAYIERGLVHADRKEWDRAFADYTEALRLQPDNAPALLYRGMVHYRRKEYDQSIADYNRAVQINPHDWGGYNNRGASYYFTKQYPQALADLNEAIRLNPKAAHPYNHRGQVYAALREPDKAVADFQEALRLQPQYGDACSNLAWLRATYPDARVRDGKQAVELATKACALASWKDPASLRTLAAAYAEDGNFDEAVRRQQQALDLGGWTASERQEEQHHLQLYREHKAFHEK